MQCCARRAGPLAASSRGTRRNEVAASDWFLTIRKSATTPESLAPRAPPGAATPAGTGALPGKQQHQRDEQAEQGIHHQAYSGHHPLIAPLPQADQRQCDSLAAGTTNRRQPIQRWVASGSAASARSKIVVVTPYSFSTRRRCPLPRMST